MKSQRTTCQRICGGWFATSCLTHMDAPNSVSLDFGGDAQARPSSSESPHGAVTGYSYSGLASALPLFAANAHDGNLITFHRVKSFRNLTE